MSFDMEGLMNQARKMQEEMKHIQESLAGERIESESSGGMVKVVVNGQQEVLEVKIAEGALEAGAEMLSDMVLLTITDALKKARELAQERLGKLTGGMNLPGMGL